MAKPRTIESLQVKKAEIEWAVEAYGRRYRQAQTDLAHINGALALFEASGDRKAATAYANFTAIWKPRELMGLCVGFLESQGRLSTRELAARAIEASGMDTTDAVLAKVVANKIVYIMRAQEKRGKVKRTGARRNTACVWGLT
jgi:hypothetical protein